MGTTMNALQSTYLLHLPSTKSKSNSNPLSSSKFPCNNSPITHFNKNHPNTVLVKPILSSFSSNSSPTNKEQKWVHEGTITESLPNGMFWVNCDNGDVILGYVSGKMRRGSIRILPGDRVKIEVSRYDSTRGRIIYRTRG